MISNVTITEPANAERTVFLKIFAYNNFKYLTARANNFPRSPKNTDAETNINISLKSKLGMQMCIRDRLRRVKSLKVLSV